MRDPDSNPATARARPRPGRRSSDRRRPPLAGAVLVALVALACGACAATAPPAPSTQAGGGSQGSTGPTGPTGRIVVTDRGWGSGGLEGPVATAGSCRVRRAPDGFTLPDPVCTPGAVDAAVTGSDLDATICRSGYTRTVRPPVQITEPAKFQAMAAYGETGPARDVEYDHLVPLELGGSSDRRNLWPQPDEGSPSQFDRTDPYGINAKDGVEDRLHDAVCSGRIALAAAQSAIASDWTTAESRLGVAP